MNMTTNNRYDIRLKGGNLPQPDAIEKVGGISSVWYDKKENSLSLTIDGKHADDAAEILQEVVSTIRLSGGEVITEKIVQPCLT